MKNNAKYNILLLILILSILFTIIALSNDTSFSTPLKGMTISCQTWGYEWSTPEMKEALVELKELGINSVSIHPYARIMSDGEIKFDKSIEQNHITMPLKWTNELGMKFMLKPHLAYWGTGFSWRGDISFKNENDWDRFFDNYLKWMIFQAKIAEKNNADIFCIGTEYEKTVSRADKWRHIIFEIRKHFTGKLVYAANWDSFEKVEFWDALDYIGIQAYFPLSDKNQPNRIDIEKGWKKVYSELIPFARKWQKKIIFTELGYDDTVKAAQIPWKASRGNSQDFENLQSLLLQIALEQANKYPQIEGVFLWKWFPDIGSWHKYENYILQTEKNKKVINQIWKKTKS